MSRFSWPFLAALCLCTLSACLQANGETCQLDSDCESGLCCKAGRIEVRGVCAAARDDSCPAGGIVDASLPPSDAAVDGEVADASELDAEAADAGASDAEAADAGGPDAGQNDAGVTDAQVSEDASTVDANMSLDSGGGEPMSDAGEAA